MKIFFLCLGFMWCFVFNQVMATATITGTITDQITGLPISGALVQAIKGNQVRYSDTTDASGIYILAGIQPSNYTLVITAPGYQNQIVGVKPPNNQTTVVNVQLIPQGGTISGVVTDAVTLLPIANATIAIFQGLNLIMTTTTNGSGFYSVADLAPGTYIVLARATTYRGQVQGAQVESGVVTTVNFALLSPPGTISGTITDAITTDPIAGALVEIFLGFTKVGFADTDNNGNYSVAGLAPDSYTVVATAQGYQSQIEGASVIANVITDVDFALTPNPGSVAGQVSDARTGIGIAGATVAILQGVTIISSAVTDTNGNYTIEDLAPGEYIVVANAAHFGIAIMGVAIVSDTISTVNFALEADPGTIAGQVTNASTSDPIAGASIQLFDNVVLIASTVTDPDGSYQLPNIAPGEYTVVVIAQDFQEQTEQAVVSSDTTTIVNFSLSVDPGTIIGTVTDTVTTDPIGQATVLVFDGRTIIGSGITDSDGNYQITNLAPGNYFVVVIASGYRAAFAAATVIAGMTTVENFALNTLPGSLTGSITQTCTADPISGVIILAVSGEVIVGFGVSDGSGNYTIANIAPGSYAVSAIKNNYVTQTKNAQVFSQASTTVNFVMVPIIPPSPKAPSTITGSIIDNRYLTQIDFLHELVWTPSPSKCVTGYIIYRNEQRIAQVPSTVVRYCDFCYAKKSATYAVQAINVFGGVSEPAIIMFN